MLLKNQWLEYLINTDSKCVLSNLDTRFDKIQVDQLEWPLTINNTEYSNSFVCSPYTAFISYCREEIIKIPNSFFRFFNNLLVNLFDSFLKWGEINKVIGINNWALTTNLYEEKSENLSATTLHKTVTELTSTYPNHLLIFRSLNSLTNSKLISNLIKIGFKTMPTRQVYIFDKNKSDFSSKINYKRDQQLLSDNMYKIITNEDIQDSEFRKMLELYNLLYLNKYSFNNPQLTEEYLKFLVKKNIMKFFILKNNQDEIHGVVSYFIKDNLMTTPIVGYDTSLPKKVGLYRRLMAIILKEAHEKNITLNLSSGASNFKLVRGGIPYIEYGAYYSKHLTLKRRFVISVLNFILTYVGVPMLKRYEL